MNVAPNAPSRPALRYHGAKWRLAPWIIEHLPPHELYCEPFGGSAAVLLRKERSLLEVYNDLDGQVVNFFRVLRERSNELICHIKLTPYAKEEHNLSGEPTDDPLESARRFYARSYLSVAGPTAQSNPGWRRQRIFSRGTGGRSQMKPAPLTFAETEHLWDIADRLRGVQIEHDDAFRILSIFDTAETCFYVDPPYPFSTRGKWAAAGYRHEMTDDDHRRLATALYEIGGMVVLSGYHCELYDELFGDWLRVDKNARINGSGTATESLWLNAAAVERRQHADLPLFNANGDGQ